MKNSLELRIKKILKSNTLFRYTLMPFAQHMVFEWKKMKAYKNDFPAIDDLKKESEKRKWKYVTKSPKVIQSSKPSKCLPEDAYEIVKHGGKILRKHDRRGEDRDFLYQMLFANLLSVKRYPVYESFVCEVPDVYIRVPDGPVLTTQFEALVQSSRLEWKTVLMDHIPEPKDQLKGRYVSLLGWSGKDYGHWLIDILTRIALIKEGYNELLFLVAEPLETYMWESLDLLGIARDQIIPVSSGWYGLDRLLICHPQQRYMVPKGDHLLEFAGRLKDGAIGSRITSEASKRIYVSRNHTRRKIVNEQDILPILSEYGFERVFAEDLKLKDQVKLFNETRFLLGPHGAGMNNDIFCQPGAVLIELYNPVRYNWCVREVANIMGHEHWFMFGKNVNSKFDMTVDPGKLTKLLDYVFNNGESVESVY